MSEKNSSSSGRSGLGYLAPAVGIAGLVATFAVGPIDLGRSVYSQIVGDTPVLKADLLDYSRRDIAAKNPNYTQLQVEQSLASELKYNLGDKTTIDHMQVGTGPLWDASEDHARSCYQQWVWPKLKD